MLSRNYCQLASIAVHQQKYAHLAVQQASVQLVNNKLQRQTQCSLHIPMQRREFMNKMPFGNKSDDSKTKTPLPEEQKQNALPDPRSNIEKFFTFLTVGIGGRILNFYSSNFYMRAKRFVGLAGREKSTYEKFWENLTLTSKQTSNFSVFRNPIAGTKDALKWMALKVLAVIIVFKIFMSNLQHLFAPRHSAPVQGTYPSAQQQQPIVVEMPANMQQSIGGGMDASTELKLKQMELEITKLKLEIEKEKNVSSKKK